jgi:hypothetical protein
MKRTNPDDLLRRQLRAAVTFTTGTAALFHTVVVVVKQRASKQVIWINARRIIAAMANALANRYRAFCDFIRKAMSILASKPSIFFSVDWSSPNPTAVPFIDVTPKVRLGSPRTTTAFIAAVFSLLCFGGLGLERFSTGYANDSSTASFGFLTAGNTAVFMATSHNIVEPRKECLAAVRAWAGSCEFSHTTLYTSKEQKLTHQPRLRARTHPISKGGEHANAV